MGIITMFSSLWSRKSDYKILRCADCGDTIGKDNGPPDGWQLECGRTVCDACCVADTKNIVSRVIFES
jgi:hypothetical protein